MIKRLLDVLIAVIGLLALLPVLVMVAVFIRMDSPGPVFFLQERIGRGGKIFRIFKFRSMLVNASTTGAYFTSNNDPRITRAGRFVRRTSLDELPQLLNVLVGDMSLVGPRPDVPAQRKNYTEEEWRLRHSIRPGITGLAQATLRSSCTEQQRKDLDINYVNNVSLLLDIKIILLTVRQVLGKGGN